MAEKYVFLNKTALNLYKNFLPGPLTIISKSKGRVAKGVESEDKTLGIRIPDYKFVIDVIKEYGKPLTATSANASYKKTPYKVSDILENLSEKQKELIDIVIDAGKLPPNKPSTVIDTTAEDITILRHGNIKIKNEKEFVSKDEKETKNLAKEIWQKFEKFKGQRAIIFALEGEMGSGKTVFTKGLAEVLGVKEEITSPTYDLVLEYKTKDSLDFAHIDTWRMIKPQEIEDTKLKEKISDHSIIAIEWADKVDEIIRSYNQEAIIIWIKIKYAKEENKRLITWGTI
jgi:tRNA threonylcarbamoyl adenosine modification protein YjeE